MLIFSNKRNSVSLKAALAFFLTLSLFETGCKSRSFGKESASTKQISVAGNLKVGAGEGVRDILTFYAPVELNNETLLCVYAASRLRTAGDEWLESLGSEEKLAKALVKLAVDESHALPNKQVVTYLDDEQKLGLEELQKTLGQKRWPVKKRALIEAFGKTKAHRSASKKTKEAVEAYALAMDSAAKTKISVFSKADNQSAQLDVEALRRNYEAQEVEWNRLESRACELKEKLKNYSRSDGSIHTETNGSMITALNSVFLDLYEGMPKNQALKSEYWCPATFRDYLTRVKKTSNKKACFDDGRAMAVQKAFDLDAQYFRKTDKTQPVDEADWRTVRQVHTMLTSNLGMCVLEKIARKDGSKTKGVKAPWRCFGFENEAEAEADLEKLQKRSDLLLTIMHPDFVSRQDLQSSSKTAAYTELWIGIKKSAEGYGLNLR